MGLDPKPCPFSGTISGATTATTAREADPGPDRRLKSSFTPAGFGLLVRPPKAERRGAWTVKVHGRPGEVRSPCGSTLISGTFVSGLTG